MSDTALAILWVAAAMLVTFALAVSQSLISARVGSDHPAHVFMANNVRSGGYRLFVRVPRLLNTTYCGAIPMYMYWVLAHCRSAALNWQARLLNPCVNTVHVAVVAMLGYAMARAQGLPLSFVGLAAGAFALTPQFYHALSARNFGLSARGTGLLLLTLFLCCSYGAEAGIHAEVAWPALVILAWLIWGFSTFAQQALCIIGAILAVVSGHYIPLIGALLGLVLFVVLHPTYAPGYLRNTLRYMRVYASQLAPVYVLRARHSIWRDLVWDVWVKLAGSLSHGARYAYGNSLLIVAALNPLLIVACWGWFSGSLPPRGLIAYAGSVTLAGAIATLATSFRVTRFLGEPERYAEAVTPWAALVGAYVLYARGEARVLAAALVIFLLVDLGQLLASKFLTRHFSDRTAQLADIEAVVRRSLPQGVRFCSNNEQFTKTLMMNDWQYVCCISVGEEYCGMKLRDAFTSYPLVRREACQRIVATYRVNACLLDREAFETLFDELPRSLRAATVAYESPRFRLLILDWAEAGA
jgi:hypothetical protein